MKQIYLPNDEVHGFKILEHRGRKLLVRCLKCGGELEIMISSLYRKKKDHCFKCNVRKTDENLIIRAALLDFKGKAYGRGLSWNLTFDQVKTIILKDCHYCASPPWSQRFKKQEWHSDIKINGIDRKENSVGYEVDNCVPCCGICNRAKSSMSYKDFMTYINNIREKSAN